MRSRDHGDGHHHYGRGKRVEGPELGPDQLHCLQAGTGGGSSRDWGGAAGELGRERKWLFQEQMATSVEGCAEALHRAASPQQDREILKSLEQEVGEDLTLQVSKETMTLKPLSLAGQVCALG